MTRASKTLPGTSGSIASTTRIGKTTGCTGTIASACSRGRPTAFLRFLCEMVHPVVRPDRDEALRLARHFNDQLRKEGWILAEEEKIAGRPRFVAQELRDNRARSVSRARSVADALDAGWMQKEIERLENAIERDPALAIGTAKDLVESCCKSILTKRGIQFSRERGLARAH